MTDWKKEFDEKFTYIFSPGGAGIRMLDQMKYVEIIDFISTTREEAKRELIEEIEKEKQQTDPDKLSHFEVNEELELRKSFNQGLSKAIEVIRRKEFASATINSIRKILHDHKQKDYFTEDQAVKSMSRLFEEIVKEIKPTYEPGEGEKLALMESQERILDIYESRLLSKLKGDK